MMSDKAKCKISEVAEMDRDANGLGHLLSSLLAVGTRQRPRSRKNFGFGSRGIANNAIHSLDKSRATKVWLLP